MAWVPIVLPPPDPKTYLFDTSTRFPIEVIYKVANPANRYEETLRVKFEYWTDKSFKTESPKEILDYEGYTWVAYQWKDNYTNWTRYEQRIY